MEDWAIHTPMSIVIVKRQADWDRIVQMRQYHVPIAHLARISQSRYLAFYLPRWHPSHPHSITHIARIAAIEVMARYQHIPEEPQHPRAQQLYVVATMHPLDRLNEPIKSRHWRRISIVHTTMEAFVRANDISAIQRINRFLMQRRTQGFAPLPFDAMHPDGAYVASDTFD